MYILLECACGKIRDYLLDDIDCMGAVKTEKEAMAWRDIAPDYRDYKYMPKLGSYFE